MKKTEIVRQLLQQSPFLAFTKEQLEKIDKRYRSKTNIFVRFGYQWSDKNGDSRQKLSLALRDRLRQLCKDVSESLGSQYKVNYASLRAEAGKPVLHKIVFDILSADILFFDVTYPNLNVFFELGIAYAANQNVFLIRPRGINDDLPSDLAGLTYCTYDFNTELTFDWRAERDIKAVFKKTIQMKINLHS